MVEVVHVRAILHVVLLSIITTKIILLCYSDASYLLSVQRSFLYLFAPTGQPFQNAKYQLYSIDQLNQNILAAVDTYANINNISTIEFKYRLMQDRNSNECVSSVQPIFFNRYFFHQEKILEKEGYISSPEDLLQMNFSASTFFSDLDRFEITLYLCSYRPTPGATDCFKWDVKMTYFYEAQLLLNVIIEPSLSGTCDDEDKIDSLGVLRYLEAFVLVLGAPYLLLVIQVSKTIMVSNFN